MRAGELVTTSSSTVTSVRSGADWECRAFIEYLPFEESSE